MSYWWQKPLLRPIRAAQYKVGDTTVYVAGRPDYERQGTSVLVDLSTVEGWLSVTDRFVPHPLGKAFAWHPWRESGAPNPEVIFGSLKTLHYWIDELKLKSVFIHCDAGTHRSVTVFGAYLDTFHKGESQDIVDNKVLLGREERHHSCPLKYWQTYMDRNPELKALAEATKNTEDNPDWGNESLDHLINRKELPWQRDLLIETVKSEEKMPQISTLEKAVIITEDHRFFKHRGVDPKSIFRAFLVNLSERRRAQGGSTITQQLARTLYLNTRKTFTRKIVEVFFALYLELRYSKQEILKRYMEEVYMGQTVQGLTIKGFRNAAMYYFNKSIKDLSIAEQAALVAIVKGPNTYKPSSSPGISRRILVLSKMLDDGMISQDEFFNASKVRL